MLDEARFAPYPVHPLPALPFEAAIPRREMRQMEQWQRLGVYTAGLAIDDAGLRERVKVMVGGAPVSQAFCDEIGADGYAKDSTLAVLKAKALMGATVGRERAPV